MKALSRLLLKKFARVARPYLKTYGLLQTAKVFNRSALVWEPADEAVVVLAPHMDDETIGCGGTLAKHVARGAQVTVVFLTDGSLGGSVAGNKSYAVDELPQTRQREAKLALESLGIDKWFFLNGEDGGLRSTPELAQRLREILIAAHPGIVYLPFFLEEHPDHRAATPILLDAVNGTSLQFRCVGYEVWTALFPNCLVRIDETVEKKRMALAHYRSQLAEADYQHTQFGLNAYRSAAFLGGSCRYAEAFCALPLADYRALYHAYGRSQAAQL